jgi:hypothetical protein
MHANRSKNGERNPDLEDEGRFQNDRCLDVKRGHYAQKTRGPKKCRNKYTLRD